MPEHYKITSPYEGAYEITDAEDDERTARIALFMPGPMVTVTSPQLLSPTLARAIAEAMLRCARDVENWREQ